MLMGIDEIKDITVELDADSLVYRIGGAVDMMGEGKHMAENMLDRSITNLYEDTGCNKCNIYLGTDTNYRRRVAKMYRYKANRAKSIRPVYYDAIRARLVQAYGACLVYQQEAEDEVGIQSFHHDDFNKFIIGAIDKDMNMIPGWHYNYATRKMIFIDKYEAMRAFYTQLVTGDMSVDNIPGLYHQLILDDEKELAHKFRYSRYKSKLIKELSLLKTELDMWKCSESVYKAYGQLDKHGYTRILEVGRLLWIRRYASELWVPPIHRDFSYIDIDRRERP